jgi:DNA adenine methylase
VTSVAAADYKGIRRPISWYGGKGNLVRHLVHLVPAGYRYYVEPFFGGGALFFRLPPVRVETINDLDSDVVALYRVLRDAGSIERFCQLAEFTPHSRELYGECRDQWEEEEADPVARAWMWWVAARQSFSGHHCHSWAYSVHESRSGMAEAPMKLRAAIRNLRSVHRRLRRTQIENAPALKVLAAYGCEGCFCYVDPPYPASTRTRPDHGYAHEMTDDDHADLIELLARLPAHIMVSGYDCDIYRHLDAAGWHRHEIETVVHCSSHARGSMVVGPGAGRLKCPRTEVVWMNYRNEDGKAVRLETDEAVTVARPWAIQLQTRMFD